MKRMMIIAVMIGALLMPAQVSAQNARERKVEKKVQLVKRGDDKRGGNKKPESHKKHDKHKKKGDFKPNHKHGKVHAPHHAHKHVVVHKHYPVHKHHAPHPPRTIVVHEHCNEFAGAAAMILGTAALVSLLAN